MADDGVAPEKRKSDDAAGGPMTTDDATAKSDDASGASAASAATESDSARASATKKLGHDPLRSKSRGGGVGGGGGSSGLGGGGNGSASGPTPTSSSTPLTAAEKRAKQERHKARLLAMMRKTKGEEQLLTSAATAAATTNRPMRRSPESAPTGSITAASRIGGPGRGSNPWHSGVAPASHLLGSGANAQRRQAPQSQRAPASAHQRRHGGHHHQTLGATVLDGRRVAPATPATGATPAAPTVAATREEEERREAIRAAHAESKRRVKLRKLLKRQGATDSEIREAIGKGAAAGVDRGASAAALAHAASVLRSAPASEPRGGRGMNTKPTTDRHLSLPASTKIVSASAPASPNMASSKSIHTSSGPAARLQSDAMSLLSNSNSSMQPPPSPQFYDTDSPTLSATQRKMCLPTPDSSKLKTALHHHQHHHHQQQQHAHHLQQQQMARRQRGESIDTQSTASDSGAELGPQGAPNLWSRQALPARAFGMSQTSDGIDANSLPPAGADSAGRGIPPAIAVQGHHLAAAGGGQYDTPAGGGGGPGSVRNDSVLLPAPAGTPPALPRADSDATLDRVLQQSHARRTPHSHHGLAQGGMLLNVTGSDFERPALSGPSSSSSAAARVSASASASPRGLFVKQHHAAAHSRGASSASTASSELLYGGDYPSSELQQGGANIKVPMRSTILSRHHLTDAALSEELHRRHIMPPASAPHHHRAAAAAAAAGARSPSGVSQLVGKRRASGPPVGLTAAAALSNDPAFDPVWSSSSADPLWDDDDPLAPPDRRPKPPRSQSATAHPNHLPPGGLLPHLAGDNMGPAASSPSRRLQHELQMRKQMSAAGGGGNDERFAWDPMFLRGAHRNLRPEDFEDSSTLAHLRGLPVQSPYSAGGLSAREAFRRRAPTSQRSALDAYDDFSSPHGQHDAYHPAASAASAAGGPTGRGIRSAPTSQHAVPPYARGGGGAGGGDQVDHLAAYLDSSLGAGLDLDLRGAGGGGSSIPPGFPLDAGFMPEPPSGGGTRRPRTRDEFDDASFADAVSPHGGSARSRDHFSQSVSPRRGGGGHGTPHGAGGGSSALYAAARSSLPVAAATAAAAGSFPSSSSGFTRRAPSSYDGARHAYDLDAYDRGSGGGGAGGFDSSLQYRTGERRFAPSSAGGHPRSPYRPQQ